MPHCPTAGNHNLIVVLQNPISSVGSLSATYNTGSGPQALPTPTGTIGTGAHNSELSVNLTGVPNASHVLLTLHNAVDSAGNSGDITVPADFLLADVNKTGLVDGNDVSVVQGNTRQTIDNSTFRSDVNCTGLIDGNDVSITQGQTRGPGLPAADSPTSTVAPAKASPAKKTSKPLIRSMGSVRQQTR